MTTEKDFNIEFPRNCDELGGLQEKIEQLFKERDAALAKAEAYRKEAKELSDLRFRDLCKYQKQVYILEHQVRELREKGENNV